MKNPEPFTSYQDTAPTEPGLRYIKFRTYGAEKPGTLHQLPGCGSYGASFALEIQHSKFVVHSFVNEIV
jgi:hypothetical protein